MADKTFSVAVGANISSFTSAMAQGASSVAKLGTSAQQAAAKAGSALDKVATAAGKLKSTDATVTIRTRDEATQQLRSATATLREFAGAESVADISVRDNAAARIGEASAALRRFDESDAEVLLTARDDARDTILRLDRAIDELDSDEAEILVRARDEASSELNRIESELKSIDGRNVSATLSAHDNASGEIEKVSSDLKSIDGRVATATVAVNDRASGPMGKINAQLGGMGKQAIAAAAGFMAFDAAVQGIQKVISASSELEQAVGATSAIFKNYDAAISEFAANSAQQFGLSEAAFRNMAVLIGAQLKNAGVPMDQLVDKTVSLIGLGSDLAAMYGGSVADAIGAVSATLRGEFDTIERYGVSLTAQAVAQEAVTSGLATSKNEVSDYAKKMSVLAIITRQTADASGQFAREADTTAGKTQRAGAELENMAAKIGDAVVPMFLDAVGVVTKFVAVLESIKVPEALQLLLGGGSFDIPGLGALEDIKPPFGDSGWSDLVDPLSFIKGALDPIGELQRKFEAVESIVSGGISAIQGWNGSFEDTANVFANVNDAADGFERRVAGLKGTLDTTRNSFGLNATEIKALGTGMLEAQRGADGFEARVATLGRTVDTFGQTSRHALATFNEFSQLARTTEWQSAGIDAATTGLAKYRSEMFGLVDLAVSKREAIEGFKTTMAEGFDFSNIAANSSTAIDSLKSVADVLDVELAGAFEAAGGNADVFIASASQIGDQLIADLGLTGDAATAMRDALNLTATDYQARFEVLGLEEAALKLQLMSGVIETLPADIQLQIGAMIAEGDLQGALELARSTVAAAQIEASIRVIADATEASGVLDSVSQQERQSIVTAIAETVGASAEFAAMTDAERIAYINAIAQTAVAQGSLSALTAEQRTATINAIAQTIVASGALDGVANKERVAQLQAEALVAAAESDLNHTARPRTIGFTGNFNGLSGVPSSITIPVNLSVRSSNLGSFGAFAPANGGILENGRLEKYANGGMRGTLPRQAAMGTGRNRYALVNWDEPETGGEAFIPTARSKRARAIPVWIEAGRRLGMLGTAGSYRSQMGALAGGVRSFAGGGILYEDDRRIPNWSPGGARMRDFSSRGVSYRDGWWWSLSRGWYRTGSSFSRSEVPRTHAGYPQIGWRSGRMYYASGFSFGPQGWAGAWKPSIVARLRAQQQARYGGRARTSGRPAFMNWNERLAYYRGDKNWRRFAGGGLHSGGVAVTGENGPEIAEWPSGVKFHSAARSRNMVAAATVGQGSNGSPAFGLIQILLDGTDITGKVAVMVDGKLRQQHQQKLAGAR
jgi:predicted translin family RNA/ssDNA-binding protein